MKTTIKQSLIAIAVSSVFAASTVHATNGYFSHGYGTKSKGLAGGGVALPQDAMSAATNPAGMVWVGSRMDIGAAIFSPNREYTVAGVSANPFGAAGFPLMPETVESDSNIFVIPHFARNWMLDADSSAGISVYGNGGMNTDYPSTPNGGVGTFAGGNPALPGGPGIAGAGVDLSQLFINATYAKKLDAKSSIGVSLITAYQRFKATGLKAFSGFSTSGANVTDVGYDDSLGFGFKLGWQGEVKPGLTYAASYQSKMDMGKLDKYSGLFAEQGGFDIPSSWTLGLAYDTSAKTTLTFDIQKINYTDVGSISNPFSNLFSATTDPTKALGGADGAGFGWSDMTIYKLGYQWQSSEDMTWRAGYSHGKQPIATSEVMFNILAPAVMETHITGGFTMKTDKDNEFTIAAMYAPSYDVTGPNPLAPDQTISIEMVQWELEASYAWKY